MRAASYFCAACVFFNVRDLGAGSLGRLQAASYFCAACVFFNARGLGAGSLGRLQAASYFCAACVFFKVRDLGAGLLGRLQAASYLGAAGTNDLNLSQSQYEAACRRSSTIQCITTIKATPHPSEDNPPPVALTPRAAGWRQYSGPHSVRILHHECRDHKNLHSIF